MKTDRSRTREETFAEMHRELRVWNPEIPESADRLDPVLKILLQLYANQLSKIDGRIDQVWDIARNSLIKSLCPESKRWPVPAHTVMHCQPSDSAVEIDQHIRFFHKEKREGGQTFFFSPHRKVKLISAEIKRIFLRSEKTLIDFSPMQEESISSITRTQVPIAPTSATHIYLAIDYTGSAVDFENVSLFLKGKTDALKQLRWAYWYPGGNDGRYNEDSGFCPGLSCNIEQLFSVDNKTVDWGGLRSSTNLFLPLEDSFIIFPREFVNAWEMGPPGAELEQLIERHDIIPPKEGENFYWLKIDLPEGGDKTSLHSPFEVYFNCFVAVNKNELVLFKHTGGNRLVEIELPEDISHILEITNVVDSNGRSYVAQHEAGGDPEQRFYSLEERGNKLVMWFDLSAGIEFPPDSITLNYSVTAGTDANGIEAGDINELYESHPGILSAENIIPTAGAIPAKTEQQVMAEVSARLRNRDRALTFNELSSWATTFDPRIKKAECANGVERTERGVRRCIIVKIHIKGQNFYSDDEISLLKTRLNSFLKSRSPINTFFQVKINKM
jgi:hypothetical protein